MEAMMRAIIDTDVLIDYLLGIEDARRELARYRKREISLISWLEVLCGADTDAEDRSCREFLDTFEVHSVTPAVAQETIQLRRRHNVRLPDAIIWATARVENSLLVTRNTKDFPSTDPGIRFPYSLKK
jgi:hypothetical protein